MFEVRSGEGRNTKNPSDRWKPAKKMVGASHDQRTGFWLAHNLRLFRRWWRRRSLQTLDDFGKYPTRLKNNRSLDCTVWSEQRLESNPVQKTLRTLGLTHRHASPTVPKRPLMAACRRSDTTPTQQLSQALKAPLSQCRNTGSGCYGL